MFDPILRRLVDPPLNAAGRRLAASGLHADTVTLAGFALGLGGAAAIVFGHGWIALALILLNRLADGLDGALARAGRQTDRGGYLDIVLDFFFYGAVPFAFALAAPQANGLAAAALLLAFYMNGASFLAFAVMAEKRRLSTEAQGRKSLYYLGGLAEGGETIAVFAAMCLFPGWFPPLAYGFALLCTVSALARVAMVMQMLKD
ncbi:CDP-alcohol phosphatidyltransferase family protein [Stappia taiwanensis]|uniref:CDP-alcohol phosphatidyltransferase family protein n=1 Tax=Stappia taiwanensis TaxID=992267 RepID=A0A838XSZ2_9HYPH|nr:CDP-alcohol phosphatidyltransferase family protein [Stappia taiwanensis]MBA4612171.1 CDP-alcohol phosphatidyltransferase family protein [Stappia taiwanensis]GGE93041.1 membrane protein [Stappia taiwanensis]